MELLKTQDLITRALQEDAADEDITSRAIFPEDHRSKGYIFVKQPGVIAGFGVAEEVFKAVDDEIHFRALVRDGARVSDGDRVAEVEGRTRALFAAERTALNFLIHLSGIATYTAKFVAAVKGTKAVILDTRKTLPGLRTLEKGAVRAGGGANHRLGLFDGVMIKTNHIRALGNGRDDRSRALAEAVTRARAKVKETPIVVEVRNLEELDQALDTSADRIMLDNFLIEDLRAAVARRDEFLRLQPDGRHIQLEASGGVSLDNVRAVAESGVDFISVGRITHSAPRLDLSLRIVEH
ncbi:MAG: carboxylating nicotinate-nucleotide diphosphorylase [bacterium]